MSNKFLNLRVEITRAGLNVTQVASGMNISAQALYNKLRGENEFTLSDMNNIRQILTNNLGKPLTLDYLFGDSDDC